MKRILTGIVGLGLLIGPWFFASPVKLFKDWRSAADWPPVEARVVSVRMVDDRNPATFWGSLRSDDTHYVVRVEYDYEGKRLAATHRLDAGYSFVSHELPREGERIKVVVNPRKPDESYLERRNILTLALVLCVAMGFGGYLLWRSLTGPVDDLVHPGD